MTTPVAGLEKLGQNPHYQAFFGLPVEDYINLVKESANL